MDWRREKQGSAAPSGGGLRPRAEDQEPVAAPPLGYGGRWPGVPRLFSLLSCEQGSLWSRFARCRLSLGHVASRRDLRACRLHLLDRLLHVTEWVGGTGERGASSWFARRAKSELRLSGRGQVKMV